MRRSSGGRDRKGDVCGRSGLVVILLVGCGATDSVNMVLVLVVIGVMKVM